MHFYLHKEGTETWQEAKRSSQVLVAVLCKMEGFFNHHLYKTQLLKGQRVHLVRSCD